MTKSFKIVYCRSMASSRIDSQSTCNVKHLQKNLLLKCTSLQVKALVIFAPVLLYTRS